ncbi:hypothetical protein BG011_002702 [Mortierella polycephala]|uniref:BTB domain-containing protein n=1 Tax=Mortierella polycephala TaxID=41804 RepID=A0A9P6QDX6_9FUNG|nr:hypothetical protein BG011_002702 [Mortierella polycephala]
MFDRLSADEGPEAIGPPPVTYMANLIAGHLLQNGASMFGRRSDANCVLKVGDRQYFVHVQMLAARSPTFRRIFDEMIANDAWGQTGDSDISSEGVTSQLSELDEMDVYDGDMQGCSHPGDMQQQTGDAANGLLREHGLAVSDDTIEQLNVKVYRSMRIQDTDDGSRTNHGDCIDISYTDVGDEDTTDQEDIEGALPELSVQFSDPDGSHFEELLYWVYTGDNERWVQFFTPENYGSILQNILHLNMVSRPVLELCLSYEESTDPSLGLWGKAMTVLSPSL